MMKAEKCVVTGFVASQREVADGHFFITVKLPLTFPEPLPGQFMMVRINGRNEPFLGRPLSVYGFARRKKNCVCEMLYRVQGRGTMLLSKLRLGDLLDIHGPLGKPFEVYPPDRQVIFIAGGMGIAPLTFLAGHYRSTKAGAKMKMVCYLGAKNSDSIIGLERMQTLCETKVSTDDASMGRLGFVTDLFRLDMTRYTPGKAVIYACGPRPMMKALAGLLADQDFPCQVSLEERMACGIGVCLGCVTAVKDHWGRKQYQRICMEGPVFGIQNVIWN